MQEVYPTGQGGLLVGVRVCVTAGLEESDALEETRALPDTDDVRLDAGLPDMDDVRLEAGLPDTDDVADWAGLREAGGEPDAVSDATGVLDTGLN